MNLQSWMLWRMHRHVSIRRICSRFGLLDVYWRNRLLPDRRSRFAHRTTYLRLALWRITRLRRNRRRFSRCRSSLLGVWTFVLWIGFCPAFLLRSGFRFWLLVKSLFRKAFCLADGMICGFCDLAALIAIFRLTVLRCLAQLLPKLLKGSICAAAERCLRRGFEGFDGSRFQR